MQLKEGNIKFYNKLQTLTANFKQPTKSDVLHNNRKQRENIKRSI